MGDGATSVDWSDEYQKLKPSFEQLASEVEFALGAIARREGIKAHSITSRVKSASSIADKARRKELSLPLEQLDDLVGIRVVVLFLSDLPRLDAVIQNSFEIHTSEDKVAGGDPATFGYMSKHYLATLGDGHAGPRYDDLKQTRFEIQTRTVVMDAWANVSHHLDYKGDSSIPEDLRKDFYALSGLFYVADQHFEIFSERAQESQLKAKEELRQGQDQPVGINLDTVEAYLLDRYPGRSHSDRASISEYVEEITQAGYEDIGALDSALDKAGEAFESYEEKYPPGDLTVDIDDPRFSDLGAGRLTLAIADRDYAGIAYPYPEDDTIAEFALWGGGA